MIAYIYILKCPISKEIVYVGKTDTPILRSCTHLVLAKTGRQPNKKLAEWINYLISKQMEPILEIIYSGDSSTILNIEKDYIKQYAANHTLFNIQKIPSERFLSDKRKIKMLIKEKRLSRTEIAKMLNVSPGAISAFLNSNPGAISQRKADELIAYLEHPSSSFIAFARAWNLKYIPH